MSIYTVIQNIVEELRNGSRDFQGMRKRLMAEGMSAKDADAMIDRLLAQVEEE